MFKGLMKRWESQLSNRIYKMNQMGIPELKITKSEIKTYPDCWEKEETVILKMDQ